MDSMNEPVEMIIYDNLKKFIKYRNIETDYKFLSPEDFSTKINTFEYIMIDGKINGKKLVIVLVRPDSNIGKKTDSFKKILNKLTKHKVQTDVIMITEDPLTKYIKKAIAEYQTQGLHIVSYLYMNFIIVLPEVEGAFVHEVMTSEEIREYCMRLLITPDMLPKICHDDPQLVWVGAKPGDMIRITGKSETAQEVEELRLVV